MSKTKKKAFIISPIGSPETDVRERADTVKDLLIKPIVEDEFNFDCKRVDESYDIPKIDESIIDHLINDDLVIADLTDHNANVFYELAVRHCFAKPVILLISSGQRIPFDISTYRAIFYDLKDVKTFEEAKKEFRAQVQAVVDGKFIPDSPIKVRLSLKKDEGSIDKIDEVLAILRNHSEILNRMLYDTRDDLQKRTREMDSLNRRLRDLLQEQAVIKPNFIETAIVHLHDKGFQILERDMGDRIDTPNLDEYSLLNLSDFSQFLTFTEENKMKGYPYINYDRSASKLWIWNSDREEIYSWYKPSLTFFLPAIK